MPVALSGADRMFMRIGEMRCLGEGPVVFDTLTLGWYVTILYADSASPKGWVDGVCYYEGETRLPRIIYIRTGQTMLVWYRSTGVILNLPREKTFPFMRPAPEGQDPFDPPSEKMTDTEDFSPFPGVFHGRTRCA
jgi:hypothetical protein